MNIIYNKNKNYLITILGILLINISISILFSFSSFLLYNIILDKKNFLFKNNIFGLLGYNISYYIIYNGLGISMFILPIILFYIGIIIILNKKKSNIIYHIIFIAINLLLTISLISSNKILLGKLGFFTKKILIFFIGYFGLFMLLCTNMIIYLIYLFKITPEKFTLIFKLKKYIIYILQYINNINYIIFFHFIMKFFSKKNIFFLKKIKLDNNFYSKKKI